MRTLQPGGFTSVCRRIEHDCGVAANVIAFLTRHTLKKVLGALRGAAATWCFAGMEAKINSSARRVRVTELLTDSIPKSEVREKGDFPSRMMSAICDLVTGLRATLVGTHLRCRRVG